VINEINYNSAADFDPGDWVEIYNPQPYDVNVSGWVFKDEVDIHSFTLPQGTIMPANGFLVLVADTTAFDALFPSVSNRLGNTGFGLSGNGELLRLYNPDVLLIDTVHYDDTAPWPTEPDGNGPTLELINPALDNALWSSWKASYIPHGTPGEVNFFVSTPESQQSSNRLIFTISPNPMTSYTTVEIRRDQLTEPKNLLITDLMGKSILKFEGITSESFLFERDNMLPGVYLLKLTDLSGKVLQTRKLIVQ
jgi:hypothetical protein